MTNPQGQQRRQAYRCPHCNEVRSYGVLHVCAEETTIIEE